jgi:hypothetical protein
MSSTVGGFSLTYSILGTLCCVGLFILVMAAIVFAAFLYRRRRSAQLLAMRAMLQQQALEPSFESEAPDLTDEPLQTYGTIGTNVNPDPNTNITNQGSDDRSDTATDSGASGNGS